MAEELVEVEGLLLPKVFERSRPMQQHIDVIRSMPMRSDDVILCAYPKSGTHWIWEVGNMLLRGKAEYEKRTKEHVMMEATDVEEMEGLPSPRLLNTHLPPRMWPVEVMSGHKVKVIHVYRNPKDVLVSLWFNLKNESGGQDLKLQDVLEMFLSDQCVGGNYVQFMTEMDAFMKENPQVPVFNMSFEETKADSVGTVRRLAGFLNVEASDQLCTDIALACSFQNMKTADKSKQLPQSFSNLPGMDQMYRKGVVGDWKNHMTVAQSQLMDTAMKQLEHCQFHITYTLDILN